MRNVYIGRHPAALEWARSHGMPNPDLVITGNATEEDVRGAHVWGVVPLHLAALAARVSVIEFPGIPPRGAEYTVVQMEAAGVRWGDYVVRNVEGSFPPNPYIPSSRL